MLRGRKVSDFHREKYLQHKRSAGFSPDFWVQECGSLFRGRKRGGGVYPKTPRSVPHALHARKISRLNKKCRIHFFFEKQFWRKILEKKFERKKFVKNILEKEFLKNNFEKNFRKRTWEKVILKKNFGTYLKKFFFSNFEKNWKKNNFETKIW